MKTLPPDKTFKELAKEFGFDENQQFKVEIGSYYFCKGNILVLHKDDRTSSPEFKRLSDGAIFYCHLSRLSIYDPVKTWDNAPDTLEAGKDIVADKDDGEALILEVGKTSFLKSQWGKFDVSSSIWFTYKEAKESGWTIKQETPKPEYTQEEKQAIELLKKNGFKIIKE